ncbi:hypothetical protein RB195_003193 [Necator americanus]|uniref:Glycosyltransferase family 92 protein n=1 Tax=Necator americanus TaxID=51031 RepID=A0ABR1DN73_NECAM
MKHRAVAQATALEVAQWGWRLRRGVTTTNYTEEWCRQGEAPKDYRCYGCNENLNCFVERLYKTLWEAYNSQMTEYDFDLAHFAPQTWYCQYRTNLNNYVLVDYSTETEELVRQLDLVYERAGVPQSYRVVIASEIRRQKSNNSTSQTSDRASVERHLLIDEKTYRRLVQIYYYDFVVFGYSLPTFL